MSARRAGGPDADAYGARGTPGGYGAPTGPAHTDFFGTRRDPAHPATSAPGPPIRDATGARVYPGSHDSGVQVWRQADPPLEFTHAWRRIGPARDH